MTKRPHEFFSRQQQFKSWLRRKAGRSVGSVCCCCAIHKPTGRSGKHVLGGLRLDGPTSASDAGTSLANIFLLALGGTEEALAAERSSVLCEILPPCLPNIACHNSGPCLFRVSCHDPSLAYSVSGSCHSAGPCLLYPVTILVLLTPSVDPVTVQVPAHCILSRS